MSLCKEISNMFFKVIRYPVYTHSTWDLSLNVRHIYFVARQNGAE